MDQAKFQAVTLIQQILYGLSVEDKLIALGAASVLEITNSHVDRDEKEELSQMFAEVFLSSFSSMMKMEGRVDDRG